MKIRPRDEVVRIALIAGSIVLLMILQYLWLTSSYDQAISVFKKETSALFRTTVFTLRDSIFSHEFNDHNGDDTLASLSSAKRITMIRSKHQLRMRLPDNFEGRESTRFETKMIMDSLDQRHGLLIRVRFTDTIAVSSLHDHYASAMRRDGHAAPFSIRHLENPEPDSMPSFSMRLAAVYEQPGPGNLFSGDTLFTEPVSISPAHAYVAIFPGIRAIALRKIVPQLMFSAFLAAVTIAAFVVMHNNLRSKERLMEIKNDFIGNVTHELKTPIATVSVALEALKDFNALQDPERTAEYLGIARHELNRLSLMTDKILKASVFEQQGVNFIPGLVKIEEIVNQVVQSLTVVLDKKHITVTVVLEGTHFNIHGSDMHMTNVVYNLMDNAIKYSHAHTSIDIRLQQRGRYLTLSIRDEGIGIDAAYHGHIFEKFFRVPNGDVHSSHGYGLGLNYVAEVTRSHGGTFHVESEPGKGSCFTLRLPTTHGD